MDVQHYNNMVNSPTYLRRSLLFSRHPPSYLVAQIKIKVNAFANTSYAFVITCICAMSLWVLNPIHKAWQALLDAYYIKTLSCLQGENKD